MSDCFSSQFLASVPSVSSCSNPFLFSGASCLAALGEPFFGDRPGVLFKFWIAGAMSSEGVVTKERRNPSAVPMERHWGEDAAVQ